MAGRKKHSKVHNRKLAPEIHAKMVSLIKMGNYMETAAAACGISALTVRRWISDGQKPGADTELKKFSDDVLMAEGESEARAVLTVQKAAVEDWRAMAWFLERRAPERWGKRDIIKIEVEKELGTLLDAVQPMVSENAYREFVLAIAKLQGLTKESFEEEHGFASVH
jgi:hypothetical protein